MSNEVRISGAQTTPRSETDIAAFHGDNTKVIAASNVAASPGPQAQFFSSDGGASWGQSALPLSQGDGDHTDPEVGWSTDGTPWAMVIGLPNLNIRLYTSNDGGNTWTFDSTPSGAVTGCDREAFCVDTSMTSLNKDFQYAAWQTGALRFARRTGSTGSWDAVQTVSGAETTGNALGCDIRTNNFGDLFVFWPDAGSRGVFVRKSIDGGATFPTAPKKIATQFGAAKIGVPAQVDRLFNGYISGGAYRDSTRDIVHAVWADLSGETGCTSGTGPGSDTTSSCKSRIWYARSTNGGANWSAPTKINDPSSKNDQFHPALAVDPTNGNLAVIYYDTVADSGRKKVDVWMQSSNDDGANWSSATRITSASTDETVAGADNAGGGGLDDQLGDYIGLDLNAGVAFPAWCDRRSGQKEEIWSTTLSLVTKRCFFIVDKSSFGQDEVGAMLAQGNGTVDAAFYIVIEGFTAGELGIVPADLTAAPLHNPMLTPSQNVMDMTIGPPTQLLAEDNSLPATPQRFTWVYPISFTSANGFTQPIITVTLNSSMATVGCSAQIVLLQQPNPYESDGQTTWLSTDLRVFHIKENESKFGATVNGNTPDDAVNFIQDVITRLNPGGSSGGQTFESNLDANATEVALNQFDASNKAIFNFAIAKVRYKAIAQDAQAVRVFFRLCPALTVSTTYDANDLNPTVAHKVGNIYQRYTDGVQYGQSISMLGTQNNNILTIPCFATKRTSGDTKGQLDKPNVQKIVHNMSGVEIDHYFGCWLDINQPNSTWYPLNPSGDGGFGGNKKSILELVRNQHQCLLSEIVFDPEPISNGATPGSSDKLAQRNLTLVPSANPGDVSSRSIPSTFELKPTQAGSQQPDELMIEWGSTPAGSVARIYLPTVSADQILELAAKRYSATKLKRLDDHTVECEVGQISYVPIPPGPALNHTGLLTVDLPKGVRQGDSFRIVVRQVTHAGQFVPGATGLLAATTQKVVWRKIRGTFQISIPVSTKAIMLEPEERLLSILRWILKSIPTTDRWYPVFSRYVGEVADRVDGLGGDSDGIRPNPNGDGRAVPPACHKIGWLISLILAPLLVLIALAPLVWTAPLTAVAIVLILAIACYWFLRCKPSICDLLAAFMLGLSVAYLVLGVIVLFGYRSPGLLLMLAILGVLSGLLVIIALLRGCCWCCRERKEDKK